MRASWPGSSPRASSIFMIFSRSASIADQSKRSEIRREKKPTWRKYMRRSSPAFWPEARGHLHLATAAAHEELRQVVELHALLGQHPVEEVLDARVLRAERLLEPRAQGLEVEEVEVE